MNVITIESEVFKRLMQKLDAIQDRLIEVEHQSFSDKWVSNTEFVGMLKISKRTAQNYRDKGLIRFSQIGKQVYYRMSDVCCKLPLN
ncbi:MAG: helix-turn-helix domain-containing protein [Bacteroidetes bacterium]|nr:helix-turn-helix domain-containing protein [Bacteroidota bacterium]